jgi:hypothetical protein
VKTRRNSGERFFLALTKRRLSPHSGLFLFFNLLYFLPLLGVLLFNYSEGGTITAIALDPDTAGKVALIFSLGCFAFLCGSRLGSGISFFGISAVDKTAQTAGLRLLRLNWSFPVVCLVMVSALLISKLLLIRAGIYSDYAFDTASMTGGIWSFSMFCAESVLFLSVAVLFSRVRRPVLWFLVLTLANGSNLLHGTRIFSMIAGVVFCFYLYVRRRFSWRIALVGAVGSLAVGYLVFLVRSNVLIDEQTFSLARIISPVMYEGVFSQISLIQTVRDPHLWTPLGSPPDFLLDAFYFVMPRVLLPQKDTLLFLDKFTYLSPMGGFSGYAQGLLYFGICFPLFYLVLGGLAAWLLRRAKDSSFWSVIYVYFACDFLFRLMRDGYIIPVKMLVNALIILAFISLCAPSTLGVAPPERGLAALSTPPG